GFRRKFRRTKSRGVHDHADARARFRKWNEPEPAVESAHHPDERGVAAGKSFDLFVMREDGKLLQVIVSLLQFEKTAEQSLASAAIEQVATCDCRSCTGRIYDVDLHAVIGEIHRLHLGFLTHFGADLARVIEQ